MVDKLCLSWADFNTAVAVIAARAPADLFDSIYGIPRGGLVLAVALSHAIGRPLACSVGPRTLVVDEIAESGATLRRVDLTEHPRHLVWTWVAKRDHGVNYVLRVPPGCWVVFPWESAAGADADTAEYHARES